MGRDLGKFLLRHSPYPGAKASAMSELACGTIAFLPVKLAMSQAYLRKAYSIPQAT